jgi:hypothetical protein
MELFHELFAGLFLFVYHCFDGIVINGSKEVLRQRTEDYTTGSTLTREAQHAHGVG